MVNCLSCGSYEGTRLVKCYDWSRNGTTADMVVIECSLCGYSGPKFPTAEDAIYHAGISFGKLLVCDQLKSIVREVTGQDGAERRRCGHRWEVEP